MPDRYNSATISKFNIKKQEDRKGKRIDIPLPLLKKRLYSIREASEYLGRTEWSVRELVWKGELPCVRIGRRVHIDIFDLNQLIDRNKMKDEF